MIPLGTASGGDLGCTRFETDETDSGIRRGCVASGTGCRERRGPGASGLHGFRAWSALFALGIAWPGTAIVADERGDPVAVVTADATTAATVRTGEGAVDRRDAALREIIRPREAAGPRRGHRHRRLQRGRVSRSRCRLRPECRCGRAATPSRRAGDIADGYYLYRQKFRFKASDGSGASLGEADFPPGQVKDDEYFGPMEVYYDSVAALVPVASAAAGGPLDVDITYQGCAGRRSVLSADHQDRVPAGARRAGRYRNRNRIGRRYIEPLRHGKRERALSGNPVSRRGWPPAGDVPGRIRTLRVEDSRVSCRVCRSSGTGTRRTSHRSSCRRQDRIAAALMSGNRLLVILSLFGAGLLLTFTPCVLPMVPILTSIIVGQEKERGSGAASVRRAFMLSFVYVIAMALTYTVAGVLAGAVRRESRGCVPGSPGSCRPSRSCSCCSRSPCSGSTNSRFRRPGRRASPPASHRQRGGTYAGVAAMGALSGVDRGALRGGTAGRGADLHRPDR